MILNELKARKTVLMRDAKAFLDAHIENMTAEDKAVYDEMKAQIESINNSIALVEEQQRMEALLAEPASDPILNGPAVKIHEDTSMKAFRNYLRTGRPQDALQVGTDSEGGYLVPDEFREELIETAQEENKFSALVTRIQTAHGTLSIPTLATRGVGYWKGEEAEYTEGADTFGEMTFTPVKATALVKISKELLTDSAFNMDEFLARRLGENIGVLEEAAIFRGTGSTNNQPLGILASTGGAATGVTLASNSAIKADELIELFYSVDQKYRANAVWAMTDGTLAAIRKLKDGAGQYLLTPGLGETPDTILGRPVITTSNMQALGTASNKVVAFGDFSYYYVAERQEFNLLVADQLYAATGQVGYFADRRIDGKLVLSEAIKVAVCPA